MINVVIRMEDCRKLNYCARGVRTFFAKHNLHYMDFLNHGISADILLSASKDDGMARAVVEVARERGRR